MPTHHSRPDHTAADHRIELLLAAAAAPTEAGRQPGEAAAVAAFRQTVGVSGVAPSRATWRTGIVAAFSALLVLGGGVTTAAVSGSLPDPAQDTAQSWLEQVGVAVPGGGRGATVPVDASEDDRAGNGETPKTDDRAQPADGPAGSHEADRPGAAGKGGEVSRTARDPEVHGQDKGAAVSELASDGRSRAGQHGGAGASSEGAGGRTPSVDGPGAQQRSEHAPAQPPTGNIRD